MQKKKPSKPLSRAPIKPRKRAPEPKATGLLVNPEYIAAKEKFRKHFHKQLKIFMTGWSLDEVAAEIHVRKDQLRILLEDKEKSTYLCTVFDLAEFFQVSPRVFFP